MCRNGCLWERLFGCIQFDCCCGVKTDVGYASVPILGSSKCAGRVRCSSSPVQLPTRWPSRADPVASTPVRRSDWRGGWSFSARVRDFQKLLVILPTSACAEAASGVLWRVPASRPPNRPAIYQVFYAKGRGRKGARRLRQHALDGALTNIFPETRTRRESDHRRKLQHAFGSKTTGATGRNIHSIPKRPPPRAVRRTRPQNDRRRRSQHAPGLEMTIVAGRLTRIPAPRVRLCPARRFS